MQFARAQSFGLGFAGQEVVQDKRTGLEIGVERPLLFIGYAVIIYNGESIKYT
ncbi:hypothetical protein H8S90_24850 [Olivibacter sp. SDN3]|uniref:hypothetical protein n=1 Tax=Olivibacter sp. SDN3 TaxID=2764720 RepID=UPI001651ACB8|nr:hypothetical protein [Olivibacter sp. SDN3]QNL49884.1 hypothetical protein H8S90_24850 [Olivibacter sp. SDN3]